MITQNLGVHGSPARVPGEVFRPDTDIERKDVRNQLQRILSSPVFQNSKRYASVLKFVVDRTLDGYGGELKERTIGIEVFNRAPDYDTATDHAVRSAAAEVRKRLAQYYQENPQDALRIEVTPGSYLPQFRWTEMHTTAQRTNQPGHAAASPADPKPRSPILKLLWVAAVLLLASVAAVVVAFRSPTTLQSFWNPILSSRSRVLLCIGNLEGGRGSPGGKLGSAPSLNLSDFQNSESEVVNVFDAAAIAKFAGLMQANGKQFRIESQSDATFTDLQNGPTILVGLLNNTWTERLVPRLRFGVEHPTPATVAIRDRNNPQNNDWSVDYATAYLDVNRDYALVLRMVDPKTEQMVVVAAGITVFGTSAAADFLTNPSEIKKLTAIAPQGWEKKNMELVLSTDVIRGQSGPASIVAAQFW
jgi:hypothetical protein